MMDFTITTWGQIQLKYWQIFFFPKPFSTWQCSSFSRWLPQWVFSTHFFTFITCKIRKMQSLFSSELTHWVIGGAGVIFNKIHRKKTCCVWSGLPYHLPFPPPPPNNFLVGFFFFKPHFSQNKQFICYLVRTEHNTATVMMLISLLSTVS